MTITSEQIRAAGKLSAVKTTLKVSNDMLASITGDEDVKGWLNDAFDTVVADTMFSLAVEPADEDLFKQMINGEV